jgi:hypothetical protein
MTQVSTVEAELFPGLDFSSRRAHIGCAKPIGRRDTGRRRRPVRDLSVIGWGPVAPTSARR